MPFCFYKCFFFWAQVFWHLPLLPEHLQSNAKVPSSKVLVTEVDPAVAHVQLGQLGLFHGPPQGGPFHGHREQVKKRSLTAQNNRLFYWNLHLLGAADQVKIIFTCSRNNKIA